MTLETFLWWIAIGAIAGVGAAILVGGYGLIADIIVGVIGAFLGGWLFRYAGWHAPWGGLGGTIFIAFIGALILLVILRIIRGLGTRRYV